MLTDEQRREAAQSLLRAERELKAIPQLSRTYPDIEIADAYRIQDYWAEARIAAKMKELEIRPETRSSIFRICMAPADGLTRA